MRRWILLGLLGLVVYAVALFVTLPAERALQWGAGFARGQGVMIAASGVSGTAWQGTAASASINGMALGRAEWSISPWALLLGRTDLHWRVQPEGGWVEGDARVASGNVQLHHVNGDLPAPLLMSYFSRVPSLVSLDGKVTLQIEELARTNGRIETLKGTLLWNHAAVVQPAPVRLGDLKVTIAPGSGGAFVGKLSDGGGPLALGGDVTVNPDLSYRLNVTVAARPGAEPTLANALPLLGGADGKGGYLVNWSGRLTRN